VALEQEVFELAALAESQLGAGHLARAREVSAEAIALGLRQGTLLSESYARLVHARTLRKLNGAKRSSEIEQALARAFELARETGAQLLEPFIRLEKGRLAELRGDRFGKQTEIQRSRSQLIEMGAPEFAERLEIEFP
jgi:hypothetical protein